MNNMLILTREPFVGFRPEDIYQWLEQHPSEENLAYVLTVVDVKAAYVWDEYEESGDYWALYAADKWTELLRYIHRKIEDILLSEGAPPCPHVGSMYRLRPFMERNGYREGSGWWFKEE